MNISLRPHSMRARMTVLVGSLIALLLFAAGSAVHQRDHRRAEARVREMLNVCIGATKSELEEAEDGRTTLLEVAEEDFGEIASGGQSLLVLDNKGHQLWASRHDLPHWPNISEDWRFKTLSHGKQTLVVLGEWAPIEHELHESSFGLWLLGITVVAGSTLVSWFVVGQTLSPLGKLADQAQNASIDTLQVQLSSPSTDAEMSHLTSTLNSLLSRLEKEAKARAHFYAAASHELRTPIQVLLGEVDVVRSRPRSVEEYRAALDEVQRQTERLAHLVRDLLQLNALELKQNLVPCEKLNIRFWVERALDQQWQGTSEDTVSWEIDVADADICAPPLHLEILLRNMLENAVKYSVPGSKIKVSAVKNDAGALLTIWNAHEGELEPDLTPWFEPFYRADASRSSVTGGNGLGLAICRAIGQTNNWKIELGASNGGVMAAVQFQSSCPNLQGATN